MKLCDNEKCHLHLDIEKIGNTYKFVKGFKQELDKILLANLDDKTNPHYCLACRNMLNKKHEL